MLPAGALGPAESVYSAYSLVAFQCEPTKESARVGRVARAHLSRDQSSASRAESGRECSQSAGAQSKPNERTGENKWSQSNRRAQAKERERERVRGGDLKRASKPAPSHRGIGCIGRLLEASAEPVGPVRRLRAHVGLRRRVGRLLGRKRRRKQQKPSLGPESLGRLARC